MVRSCDSHVIMSHDFRLQTYTVDYQITKRSFKFARSNHLPFYFVSASDGTNVVKVKIIAYICHTQVYFIPVLCVHV